MVDYRLDGLGTRTFEHLVQALSLREISTTVTPFGDGPDGAREATFDGPTQYGPAGDEWNGYGVVQAKFLQRPKSSASDGRWIISETRKELKRFARKQLRRKPQYYIIATNVTLSATEGTGSKDRLVRVLQDFAAQTDLAGFDIWDYDKIRLFLDSNEEIRKSYAAWITTGDVLSDLSDWLKSERPNYYSLITTYLQKELVSDQYARLEQAGHSADEAIPLSQVFIDLPVARRTMSDVQAQGGTTTDFVALVVESAKQRLRPEDIEEAKRHVTTPIGRYVLIGGPGQGKTTIGQYVCQIFRAALLASVSKQSLIDLEAQSVIRGLSSAENGLMAQIGARRVPFRVVLSEFAAELASGTSSGLLDHVTQGFNKRTNSTLSVKQFEHLLISYPSILVLDGLDEVPSSTNRDELIASIKEFWVDVASNSIDVLAVATSRPQGYSEEFSRSLYEHYSLIPLPTKKAVDYGERLAELRFKGDTRRIEKIVSRLSRAADVPATAKLMQSPLQVTILTLLVDRMGQPPQERWVLFNEYYKLIYQRETERDIPAARVLREHRSDIDAVHERVGLLLQVESERTGGTDAKLTIEQFSAVVHEYLLEEGHEGDELDLLKASIIKGAAERLVFLVGLELGQVGFEIRSLQEFMAAQGLMSARDELVQQRLSLIARSVNWRNVFLFAAGRVFMERKYLRDSIVSACIDLNDAPGDQLVNVVSAGSELAVELLEDGPAARHPATSSVLTRLTFRLLCSAGKWHRRLADLYQERNREIYLDELGKGILAADVHQAATSICCAVVLAESGVDGFSALLQGLNARRKLDAKAVFGAIREDVTVAKWLSENVGTSILSYPVDKIIELEIEVGNSAVSVLPELFARAGHEWVGWFIDTGDSRRETTVQLKDRTNHSLNRIGISGLLLTSNKDLPPPTLEPPGQDVDWRFLHACYRFVVAPKATALADAVDLAADARDAGVFPRSVPYKLPWPMCEVLSATSDATDLRNLATAAREGVLGDVDDWRAWEEQWASRGICADEVADVLTVGSGSVGAMWFPLRVISIIHGTSLNPIQIARRAWEFRNTAAWELVAIGLIARPLRRQSDQGSIWEDGTFRSTVFWLTERAPSLGIEIVCAVPPPFQPTEKWAKAIGGTEGLREYAANRGDPGGVEFLVEAWQRWPEYEGILLALASRVRHVETARRICASPERMIPKEQDREDLNLAKILLMMRSGRDFEDILPHLSRRWATVRTWNYLARMIVDEHGPLAERNALMLRQAAVSASVASRTVDTCLRTVFRRRVSGLADRVTWDNLELPRTLFDLL